jgi:hypothetical protein
MSRKVRDATLETRTARHRLAVRKEPFYRLIEPGLHLGYRKLANAPGTWLARRLNSNAAGGSPYTRANLTTTDGRPVIADDYSEPTAKRSCHSHRLRNGRRRSAQTRGRHMGLIRSPTRWPTISPIYVKAAGQKRWCVKLRTAPGR